MARRAWLSLLLFACSAGCGPDAAARPSAPSADPAPAAATRPDATAFDALYARLNGPASLDMATSDWDQALDRLQALAPPGDPRRDARLHALYCSHSRWGQSPELARYIDAGMRLAVRRPDPDAQALLAYCLASYHDLRGDGLRAIAALDAALALATAAHDPLLRMQVLSYRGDLHSLRGNQARALIDYDQARRTLEAAGLGRLARHLLSGTGMVYRRMGEYARALAEFEKLEASLPPTATWEDHFTIAMQKGFLYTESDAAAKGVAAFREALALARAHGSPTDRASALTGLAQAQVASGDPAGALASVTAAEREPDALFNATDHGVNALVGGLALAGLDRQREALARFDAAFALLGEEGNPRYLAWLHEARSHTEEALGDARAALADYRRYVVLQRSLDALASRQQGLLASLQASARQRDLENRRLRQAQHFQRLQLAALQKVRRWQSAVLVLGVLLVLSLLLLMLQLQRRARQLRHIATVDSLTQLANRRSIYASAQEAVAGARASGRPLSALVVDIDRFKSINDRYGHPAGDRVLVAVADCCAATLRSGDLAGRAGGEEFLVLCPDTTLAEACGIGERLLQAVRALRFEAIDPALRVSISVGAATLDDTDGSLEGLVGAADRALYAAKQGGRDRLVADAGGDGAAAPDLLADVPPD